MKKFLSFALIGLLVAGLFVSCSSDVEDEKISYGLCSVDFNANSKGLQVTVDGNLATSGTDEFFWSYKATKLDSYGKEGEKTSITKFYNDTTTKGLAKLENLSTGKWKFELFAFLDGARSKQVYDGSIEVVLNADVENAIAVPMKRSQVSGQKGKLVIDPTKVNIAYDAGTVVVTNKDGESYVDVNADRMLFGKLSDYSYCVYKSDENWMTFTTLTDASDKEVCTDVYSADFEPGTYYIEIKLSEKGKNDANTYIAMLVVEIYSNCTTEILDDGSGDNSGIVVKRLKEFKITYYEGKDTTIGYATDEKREVGVHPESKGTHSNVESDYKPSGVEVYPQYHQYGRSELLDVPTRPEYGFAGWYMNFECTGSPVRFIDAYHADDIILYAKWGELKYSAITWDDNFPASYKGLSYDGKSLITTGNAAKVAHVGGSTACTITQIKDSLDVAKSPENPVCPGYMFKGWYYDDASLRSPEMMVSKSLLPEPKAQIDKRAYKALWEPMKYTIVFHLNSSTSGYCPDDADFGEHLSEVAYVGTTYANKTATINAEYGLADVFNDASSKKKGFLGWSFDQNATGTEKCVNNENILNLWNDTSTQPTNNATIHLYAVWSDYFVPLEYIRSYPSGVSTGPYIDTLLPAGTGAGKFSDIEIVMEWAGTPVSSEESICGVYTSGYWDFSLGNLNSGSSAPYERNGSWRLIGAVDNHNATGGLYFEDDKYVVRGHIGADGTNMSVDGETVVRFDENSLTGLGNNLFLFCRNDYFGANQCADIRLYSCKIYNSLGNIERKFIPCRLVKKVDVAARSSDGLTTHKGDNENGGAYTGEVGLWDLVENKFYPNKQSGAEFYEPHDEVKVTLKSNYTDSEQADRVQRVLSGTAEKLHKNVFSNVGKSFLSWNTKADGTGTDVYNRDPVTYTADTTLYAKWTGTTSWALFGQVDYIENHDYDGGATPTEAIDTGLAFGTFGGSYRITMVAQFLRLKGYKGTTDKMDYPVMIGCYTVNNFADDFGREGLIQRIMNGDWGAHWGLYDDSNTTVVKFTAFECPGDANTNKVKLIAQTEAGVGSSFNYYQGANLDTWVAGASCASTKSVSSRYKASLYLFAMHNDSWGSADGSAYPRLLSDGKGHSYSNFGYGRVYSLVVDNLAGSVKANFVPCVLNQDLDNNTGHKVVDGDGNLVLGTSKVYGGQVCHKGEAGLWDTVNDRFHPNIGGKAFIYPTDKFLIRYDANGGIGVMADQSIASTATARLSECRFERDGYEFIGWTDQPKSTTAGVKWYSPERVMHPTDLRNMTLFAQWRKNPTTKPYIELEYIRNDDTGFAWIDTGVVSQKNFRVNYKLVKTINLGGDCPFGRSIGTAWKHVGTIYSNSIYVYGTPYDVAPQTLGVPVTVDVQSYADLGGSLLLAYSANPGKSATGKASPAIDGATVTNSLFGVSKGAGGENPGCAFYFAKIYDDKEILVRDMIPVMLTQDTVDVKGVTRKKNSLGMWDKCNNKFYANANTASKGYFVNDEVVTIVFDGNGGNGVMDSLAFLESNEKVALTKNVYTHPQGKAFIGWNTKADGTGVWYCDEYNSNEWKGGVLLLYAQWEKEKGLIYTDYFEPVNKVMLGNGAYINLGPIDEAYVNCTYYNTDFTNGGFFMGADNYPGSGGVKRFNPNLLSRGTGGTATIGVGKCVVSINCGSTGAWTDTYITSDGFDKGVAFDYLNVYANPATGKFGYSASQGVTAFAKDLGTFSGDFRCGNDWYLFASSRNNVYNANAVSYNGGYCGGVKWVKQDGTVWFKLVPCRLKKKIGSYVAGKLAADKSSHKSGEVGFWDIENNIFYGNGSALGEFYCELD